MIALKGSDAITQAMRLAAERGLLPTEMGSAELQEMTLRLRERVFFSARTANLWYLDKLKSLVERYVKGEGRDNDLAQLRVEARRLLAQAGYTPEGGFPGDEALGIPPATAGSLRDLSSERRLNLIFQTQAQMMRGLGLKLRGHDRSDRWPAWELVRVAKFSSEHQREWLKRWKIAADNVDGAGVWRSGDSSPLRMIALKSSPVWQALGSSALFPDALNTDHPPFAFSSGMGWREVPIEESRELVLLAPDQIVSPGAVGQWSDMQPVPAPKTTDPAKLERNRKLKARLAEIRAREAA